MDDRAGEAKNHTPLEHSSSPPRNPRFPRMWRNATLPLVYACLQFDSEL
jgi:hypothetical protein